MSHPTLEPGGDFDAHQREMAAWMGYESPVEMNRHHDRLHYALCDWLGVPSHSMLDAKGQLHNHEIAAIEENAVVAVQRLMARHKVGVPE